jgi:hypothetical protein
MRAGARLYFKKTGWWNLTRSLYQFCAWQVSWQVDVAGCDGLCGVRCDTSHGAQSIGMLLILTWNLALVSFLFFTVSVKQWVSALVRSPIDESLPVTVAAGNSAGDARTVFGEW